MRRTAHGLLVLLFGVPLAHAQGHRNACTELVDVPEARVPFSPDSRSSRVYRRAHDLLRLFAEGDGELEPGEGSGLITTEHAALYPLPWRVSTGRAQRLRLLTWQDRSRGNDESMPVMVLRAGASWCSPELSWERGARLRFEAFSVERGRPASLEVDEILAETLSPPSSLDRTGQRDLALEGKGGRLCFRAREGTAAIGEPRVLVPEDVGSDSRPRWIVLTIFDALRGDLLRNEEAGEILPALETLATFGHHYRKAVSPGCHTRAAVWPILMGRDLMRIDPLKRRQSMPIQSPLEDVFSRANLFVSQLAESAGYHSVFLGNNSFMRVIPAFSRYSSWGSTDRGTIDTVATLPELFERYADERVFLHYYISTPHGQSQTPQRLYEAFGCAALEGVEQCQCAYEARVRHGDEALDALQAGLRAYGLSEDTLHVLTADHGELLGDGMRIEGEMPTFATGARRSTFERFDRGHGNGCHVLETDVPLVVHGRGIEAAIWDEPVSGLDVVPTLLQAMELSPVSRLDGRPLPLSSRRASSDRRLVSYGFCSDSVIQGDEQLVWWVQGCRLREMDTGDPLGHRSELWRDGRRIATDETRPEELRRAMLAHEDWVRDRLPTDAFVFDTVNLDATEMTISVEGRITDYGPASTAFGLDGVREVRLSAEEHRLTLRLEGYRGLYYVATRPPHAPVSVSVDGDAELVTFVGPLQLPLPLKGPVDPSARPTFFVAERAPEERPTSRPALRLWWQTYGHAADEDGRALSDFDRVLREWGYIR